MYLTFHGIGKNGHIAHGIGIRRIKLNREVKGVCLVNTTNVMYVIYFLWMLEVEVNHPAFLIVKHTSKGIGHIHVLDVYHILIVSHE